MYVIKNLTNQMLPSAKLDGSMLHIPPKGQAIVMELSLSLIGLKKRGYIDYHLKTSVAAPAVSPEKEEEPKDEAPKEDTPKEGGDISSKEAESKEEKPKKRRRRSKKKASKKKD